MWYRLTVGRLKRLIRLGWNAFQVSNKGNCRLVFEYRPNRMIRLTNSRKCCTFGCPTQTASKCHIFPQSKTNVVRSKCAVIFFKWFSNSTGRDDVTQLWNAVIIVGFNGHLACFWASCVVYMLWDADDFTFGMWNIKYGVLICLFYLFLVSFSGDSKPALSLSNANIVLKCLELLAINQMLDT